MHSLSFFSMQASPVPTPALPTTTITALSTKPNSNDPLTEPHPLSKVRRTNRISKIFNTLNRIAPEPIFLKIIWYLAFSALVGLILTFFATFFAAIGGIIILTGNGILRAAHLPHYTNNASAAYIGVVGSFIPNFIWFIILAILKLSFININVHDEQGNIKIGFLYIQLASFVLFSPLSGAIGCAILLRSHADLGGIDVLHATRAGALGGAIILVGLIFVKSVIFIGAPWVVQTIWTYRSHSYCSTRGDDPEMNAELEGL